MRFISLAKLAATSMVLGFLASCGGSSSSSGCLANDLSCQGTPETINALGSDGPLANAVVEVFRLQDYLNGAPAPENLVLEAGTLSGSDGLINNLELKLTAGTGPFVLQVSANPAGGTIDTTTGLEPVITSVRTIIRSNDFGQRNDEMIHPNGVRFYATAFTTMAIDLARTIAGDNTASTVVAQLGTASQRVLQNFGFGLDVMTDIFAVGATSTPPVLDETTTIAAKQQQVAAHRLGLEVFVQVLINAASGQSFSPQDVFAAVSVDLASSAAGEFGEGSRSTEVEQFIDQFDVEDPSMTTAPPMVSNTNDLVLDPAYIASRVPDIEVLLDGELAGVSATLAGMLGDLNLVLPQLPDSDGDGISNNRDDNDLNDQISSDADGDGIDDSPDNCVLGALDDLGVVITLARAVNPGQANSDPDEFGDQCDNDADGDGENGDGSGGPSATDIDDLDNTTALDPDMDGIDSSPSAGAGALNGPDNCPNVANAGQENYDNPNNILGDADDLMVMGSNVADLLGNVCDPDGDGDGFQGPFGGGDGTETAANDLNENAVPGEADADGVLDEDDNCPATPNALQTATGTSLFGDDCDMDDDGFPDESQNVGLAGGSNIPGFDDTIAVDNCPSDANPGQEDNDVLLGSDGGDACDLDDDNDGIPDLLDPAPFNSIATYNFDTFYLQQSASTANAEFKLATISESVLFNTGAIASSAGVNNLLDIASGGADSYFVDSTYQVFEDSVEFTSAGAGFGTATTTVVNGVFANGAGGGSSSASYTEPQLTLEGVALSPWGSASFIGSVINGAGRPDLMSVVTPLLSGAGSAERGLVVLSYVDNGLSAPPSAPDVSTLNGNYGFVDMSISYGTTTATDLLDIQSRVYDATFDGLGGVTAGVTLSQFDAVYGEGDLAGDANGTITFSNSPITETAYAVTAQGAVSITGGAGMRGIVDNDGELMTLSNGNMRGYAVKLDNTATIAQLIAQSPYDLMGLIVKPDVGDSSTSGGSLEVSALEGATLTFDGVPGSVSVTLELSGAQGAVMNYDQADGQLPSVANGPLGSAVNQLLDPANPDVIGGVTLTGGRFTAPIEFGTSVSPGSIELEGFFVPGKGLLLRYVDTVISAVGAGSGGTSIGFACGDPADLDFVDATGALINPQPADGTVACGLVLLGNAGSLKKVTDRARDDAGNAQSLDVIDAEMPGGDETTFFNGTGFGQGIVWGIPQNP